MKALILVGGFGTRLRPLTFKMAKPLVPFVNKPMIMHQVEALKAVGVTEVVLAIAYQPDAMKAEMEEWGKKIGVKFTYSIEDTPLGTAGPIALAKETLAEGAADEPFFVLNSDVTCQFPLKELLAHHKSHGKEGTIVVTQVKDWTKYGVVVYDEKSKQISTFAEKPKEFVGDRINAGIYIFNKTILNRIKLERIMIETGVFPNMAAEGQLFCFELEGFWADIGQPHDYLDGLAQFLPSLSNDTSFATAAEKAKSFSLVTADLESNYKGVKFVPNTVVLDLKSGAKKSYPTVCIHPTATVGEGCVLGPNVTIGPNCKIGPYTRLQNCAILDNSVVGAGVLVSRSIVGWNNRLENWCRVENNCVFGDDVGVKAEVALNDVKVCPNKDIKESTSGKVLM